MQPTVEQVFSAKLSLEARIVLFVLIGAKIKLEKGVPLKTLVDSLPFAVHRYVDELAAEGFIKGNYTLLLPVLEKLDYRPYGKLLEQVQTHQKGATPTKTLLKHFNALYANSERRNRCAGKDDFRLMHGLTRKWAVESVFSSMETYFVYCKAAHQEPTMGGVVVYTNKHLRTSK
jgi:hypothetical protein